MKYKLLNLLTLAVFLFGVSIPFVMGSGGDRHHNKKHQISLIAGTRTSGPILRGYSEFSEFFNIKIGNDSYAILSDDGYLEFDLFPLNLGNGRHRVEITPSNKIGEAFKVVFNLQITGKNPKLWQILLLKDEEKYNPEYPTYFSSDLAIYISN